jgi:hypothetical protein
MVIFVINAPFTNGGHGDGFASSVAHPRSNSVELLVYDGMHIISWASVLYYRSLGSLQPCKKGVNILGRL